jgi:methionyl-tRNA formyltransferase
VIVIAGKNNIAVHALNSLVRRVGSNAIVALPNKNDSGVNTWQQSLRLAANKKGVRVASLEDIEGSGVRLFVSLEYDRIINPTDFPAAFLCNIHFSALPKYKGMFTSIWPVIFGDEETAVTLHEIDQGIDTGKIYAQRMFDICRWDRSRDVYRKYIKNATLLFDECINNLLSGALIGSRQSAINSSYFSKKAIDFSSLKINLKCTAWELQRQIYAYTFREYQIPEIFGKPVVELDITPDRSLQVPGSLVADSGKSFRVATIDYDVVLYVDKLPDVLRSMQKCRPSEISPLLKHIAGVNDRNEKGWSPIIVAAFYGNYDVVEKLLDFGADVNDFNNKGTTVLMYAKDFAIEKGDKRVFDFLRSRGADIKAKDFNGKSLIDYLNIEQVRYLGIESV